MLKRLLKFLRELLAPPPAKPVRALSDYPKGTLDDWDPRYDRGA
jgi:hypothetical protein